MVNLTESFRPWWDDLTAANSDERLVVVGPRKSGKSQWFRQLSQETSRYRYWNALRSARATDTRSVWASVFACFGTQLEVAGDPIELLDKIFTEPGESIVVVVDDWDLSLGSSAQGQADGCYEVLDALARYSLDQPANTKSDCRRFGLILITSLLDVVDLQEFVRLVRRPAFERLSGVIAREFRVARVPFLTRCESMDVLREIECMDVDLSLRAEAIGGWLWLLVEGADMTWGGAPFRDLVASAIQESAYLAVAARSVVIASGMSPASYVSREISLKRKRPAQFGLPSAYSNRDEPAACVVEFMGRTVMFVDVENIRMPFQRDAQSRGLPVEHHLTHTLVPAAHQWLVETALNHGVADQDVYLVGRSKERINESVGDGCPGNRLFLPDALRKKRDMRGGDSSDDALLVAVVARMRAENPFTKFVVMTGDMDIPLILRRASADDRMTIRAPWGVSQELRRIYSDYVLETETFPLRCPSKSGGVT